MPIFVKEHTKGSKCRVMMLGNRADSFFLEDFIKSHQLNAQDDVAILVKLIDLFSNTGRIRNERKVRKLENADGLFEFKTPSGLRVTWFWEKDYIIVCGYCFVKKSDKTPKRLIDTSITWMKAYQEAQKAHTVVEIK
jgi:phage-related protein